MRPVWVVCALLVFVSCRRETSAATPELAYRSFIDALNRGQARRAWGYLSTSTKERVQAKSKELSLASKGLVRDEPETLLFAGSRPPASSMLSLSPVRSDENTAVLTVSDGGGSQEVKLVKDSGKWFIDLSERL